MRIFLREYTKDAYEGIRKYENNEMWCSMTGIGKIPF